MRDLFFTTCLFVCHMQCCTLNELSYPFSLMVSSCISTGVTILSTGAAVGIPIAVFLVSFLIGAMLVVLITYCCVRKRKKSSGQLQPSCTLPEPLQPSYNQSELPHEYCEVEIKRADTLELKENVAYGPVGH